MARTHIEFLADDVTGRNTHTMYIEGVPSTLVYEVSYRRWFAAAGDFSGYIGTIFPVYGPNGRTHWTVSGSDAKFKTLKAAAKFLVLRHESDQAFAVVDTHTPTDAPLALPEYASDKHCTQCGNPTVGNDPRYYLDGAGWSLAGGNLCPRCYRPHVNFNNPSWATCPGWNNLPWGAEPNLEVEHARQLLADQDADIDACHEQIEQAGKSSRDMVRGFLPNNNDVLLSFGETVAQVGNALAQASRNRNQLWVYLADLDQEERGFDPEDQGHRDGYMTWGEAMGVDDFDYPYPGEMQEAAYLAEAYATLRG
jgi:hypothetical protein